jgi:Ca2+-binding RTX toxin-like protein
MAMFNGTADDDVFTGGTGADTAYGNGGNDSLSGDGSSDILVGGGGEDVLDGGAGDDKLYSGDESPPFNQPYYGNPYTPPVLDAGAAVDTLVGGAGSDRLFAGYGDNVDGGTDGGYGGDYLYISFLGATIGVTADFRQVTQVIGGGTITGVENISWVQGSNFADDINVGSYANNGYSDFTAVFGMGGNDRLVAGYYTGVLFGGDGDDIVDGRGSQYLQSVDGGAGDDTLYTNTNTFASAYGGDGNDTIYSHGLTYGGAGNDLIIIQQSYYGGWVYGEAGDDQIQAATSGNALAGGVGADILIGTSANDTLYSADRNAAMTDAAYDMGLEHDQLTGFGGDDQLAAGYGDDVDGGSGTDTLRLSFGGLTSGVVFSTAGFVSGQPLILGGGTIQGVETLVQLRGTEFADTLTLVTQTSLLTVDAGAGDDVIISSGSSVAVAGGAGDDRFVGGIAGDTFDGGAGSDTIDYGAYASAVTVSLVTGYGAGGDQLTGVENIIGSDFGDTLTGDVGDNTLDGRAGVDTLSYAFADAAVTVDIAAVGAQQTFGAGTDTLLGFENLIGSKFNDTLRGNGQANILTGDTGNDILSGRGGADTLNGGAGTDTADYGTASAGIQVDLATQLAANDGDGAADVLSSIENVIGSAFSDLIHGGAGANTLRGGQGDDNYTVDGADLVIEATNGGWDSVFATANYTLSANIENLTLQGSATSGTGNDLANNLYGNDLSNNLSGGAGDDYLAGGAGADALDGGAGADTLDGGLGDDSYVLDSASDTVTESADGGWDTVYATFNYALGANVESVTLQGTATDATGNDLANTLYGNDLSNHLHGGAGADTLSGGAGDDTLDGGVGGDVLDGGDGIDLASYAGAASGVTAFLGGAALNAGEAAGDTYAGIENLEGSAFADILGGTDAANAIMALAGDDFLYGGGGDDMLTGGVGTDRLNGGAGADTFIFRSGDSLSGAIDLITDFETGIDVIDLGAATGAAIVHDGGTSLLFVNYASGEQSVIGVSGAVQGGDLRFSTSIVLDVLGAGAGEFLAGGVLDDRLFGQAGDDVLTGGLGGDALDGGAGFDYASYAGAATGVTVFLGGPYLNAGEAAGDSYAAIEGVIGSAHADLIGGTNGGDALQGGDGNDWLLGAGGDDWLVGATGNDLLEGGSGHDVMDGGSGDDVASYRQAAAGVTAYMSNYLANVGEAFGDQYTAIENLWGSDFADTLGGTDAAGQVYGFGGADTLNGLGGDDALYGGDGADAISGGTGADTFFFLQSSEGGDTITDFVSGQDRVFFSEYWFGLPIAPAGSISASRFVSGDHPAAAGPGASFLFDTASHQLLFDPDGSGAQAAILMATFSNGVNLTAGDIWAA